MSLNSYKVNEEFDGEHQNRMHGSDFDRHIEKPSGCFVKSTTGFCMVFLALATIAMVAVIVYFTAENRDIVCNCQSSNTATNPGSSGQCPSQPKADTITSCPPCSCSTTAPLTSTALSQTALATTTPTDTTSARLPHNLTPVHYDITLRPDIFTGNPANFSKIGHVRIHFLCQNETDKITLDVSGLVVDEGTVQLHGSHNNTGSVPQIRNMSRDGRRQFLHFHLGSFLQRGERYIIQMNYTGPLTRSRFGLYYNSYTRNGSDVYIVTTLFHPTNARNAFPCFDEPSLKATFSVTLERKPDNGYVSLSNMPLICTEPSTDGFVADTFNTTVKMSTYLLAFAICDYMYKENITRSGILVKKTEDLYVTRDNTEHKFLRPDWKRANGQLRKLFRNSIFITKYDMISFDDFIAGALETWGLVTYRSIYILYDPRVTSASQYLLIARVISHENAHMWFGNLVTPSWWGDTWLNEGFATFMELLGVDMVHPEWNMMNNFGVTFMHPVMTSDSVPSTRAMYKDAEYPDEILGLFDIIAYYKSACVIRMMWHFLGPENFRHGIQRYILNNMFGSVTHDQLWQQLQQEMDAMGINIDVTSIMKNWINQKHFPLVTLTRSNDIIRVTQEPLIEGQQMKQNLTWEIPLTYTSEEHQNFDQNSSNIIWMSESEEEKHIAAIGQGWILGNIQQYGYYRVNYDDKNWRALIQQLNSNHTVIHTSNRAQIIDDIWALVSIKKANISHALSVFDYLENEEEYAPWITAVNRLNNIGNYIGSQSSYNKFQAMMKRILRGIFTKVGLVPSDGESMNIRLLRSAISLASCKYGLPECETSALQEFSKWKQNPNLYILIPDVKSTVLCTGIRHGTVEDWDFVYGMYSNSTPAEQEVIRNVLACSNELWVLNRYLEYAMDDPIIRTQDVASVIVAVSQNPIGKYLAWLFINTNWATITKTLDQFALQRIITLTTDRFITTFERLQIEALKAAHPPDAPRLTSFDAALDVVQTNIDWMEENYQPVEAWLQNY